MKHIENPDWYKLIKAFKAAEPPYKISTGLTIPFLIGAYELLGSPFRSVEDLILTILNSEIDKFPVIQKCHYIQKHVLMVEGKEICNKTYRKEVKFESPTGRNILFISSNSILLGKELPKVIWNLSTEYSDPIRKCEYSWSNAKGWKSFDEKEKEIIKSIK
ncbi:MAG: hypothetical protein V4722_01985 [Bacteroidota bacterium]